MARDEINYKYFHSNLMDLDYCMHKTTGLVIFKDATTYNQDEIKLLNKINKDASLPKEKKGELIKKLHALKNVFKGTIITDEKIQEIKDKEGINA